MNPFFKLIIILSGSVAPSPTPPAPPDPPGDEFLLLESGDAFLLETSDKLILE